MKFVFELDCNKKFSGGFKNKHHDTIKFHEVYFKDILSSLCFLEGSEKRSSSFTRLRLWILWSRLCFWNYNFTLSFLFFFSTKEIIYLQVVRVIIINNHVTNQDVVHPWKKQAMMLNGLRRKSKDLHSYFSFQLLKLNSWEISLFVLCF